MDSVPLRRTFAKPLQTQYDRNSLAKNLGSFWAACVYCTLLNFWMLLQLIQPFSFCQNLTFYKTEFFILSLVVYERCRSQVFGSNNFPRGLCQHVFTNAVDLKCLDPTIFLVTYASTFLLAAVAVFSDLNIDGCCDDHGFPLFVLSLLRSHDSVSLCVVLLNKIRFVY